jgi:AGCS family alanine or glycine:cation symporter
MYFLPIAYKSRWIAPVICVLLGIYGVEIFMFNVMTDSIAVNWNINIYWVIATLLAAILIVAIGGINRVGEVCSTLIPLFILIYVVMCFWVLIQKYEEIPAALGSIFEGAFTRQAAQGGFAGSSVMLAMSMGLSRGAYSGDLGIGYNAIIYAESQSTQIRRISSLPIIGVFIDTFVICTLSILVVLVTGYWKSGIDVSLMVQEALGLYFPYTYYFMPFFLFLLGYTTILAYFVVGVKCAKFLSPKWGPPLYYLYASITFPLFALVEPTQAFLIMSLAGACLLILNLFGMFLLRKEIIFGFEES